MRTNTPRQQANRRMRRFAQSAQMQADIEAGYQATQAYLAEFRQHATNIATLRAQGATEAAILQVQEAWLESHKERNP